MPRTTGSTDPAGPAPSTSNLGLPRWKRRTHIWRRRTVTSSGPTSTSAGSCATSSSWAPPTPGSTRP